MSTAEIIAQLPQLSAIELSAVQAKLDELAGEVWHDHAELSEADQVALNTSIAEYQSQPDSGRGWDQVKANVRAKLRP